jgi:hypothetical protein
MSIVVDTNSTAGDSLQQEVWSLSAPYKAATAVTAKRVVVINTTGKVAISATDSTATLCVGIARNAIAAGDSGQVIRGGIAENVPCDGTVSAGDVVKRSATTAGSVAATATPALGEAVGVAINASASNVVDVDVRALGISDT